MREKHDRIEYDLNGAYNYASYLLWSCIARHYDQCLHLMAPELEGRTERLVRALHTLMIRSGLKLSAETPNQTPRHAFRNIRALRNNHRFQFFRVMIIAWRLCALLPTNRLQLFVDCGIHNIA